MDELLMIQIPKRQNFVYDLLNYKQTLIDINEDIDYVRKGLIKIESDDFRRSQKYNKKVIQGLIVEYTEKFKRLLMMRDKILESDELSQRSQTTL